MLLLVLNALSIAACVALNTISGAAREIFLNNTINSCLKAKTSHSNSMTYGSEPFAKSAPKSCTNSKEERSIIFFNSVS